MSKTEKPIESETVNPAPSPVQEQTAVTTAEVAAVLTDTKRSIMPTGAGDPTIKNK